MTQKDLNLRQRRWLQLLKDYELVIDYHPGKANVVADALNRKSLFALRAMNKHLTLSDDGSILAELKVKPQIFEAQKYDNELQAKRVQCQSTSDSDFQIRSDDCLMFRGRIFVPKNSELIQKILQEHTVVHPGSTKMYNDLKQLYWWPRMKRDISEFVSKCLVFLQVKAEHRVPSGLLHPVMIPEQKSDRVTMDFVSGLPMSLKKKDAIWIVVDRLTKSTHFIPVHTDYSLDKLAELYIFEIFRLHGVPVSIISNRDLRLNFNTEFHPQINGQSERVIQILEDMLRCCVLESEGNWERFLSLLPIECKSGPYKALYGHKCRTPLYWTELSEKNIHGVDLIRETEDKVKSPRFIGPYEIIERLGLVAYRFALPSELEKIHNVFHVSMLQRYRLDPLHVILPSKIEIQPDMTYNEEPIKILAREVKRLRNKSIVLVQVLWKWQVSKRLRGSPRKLSENSTLNYSLNDLEIV
ncbi:DNA/RNA polymerases superfamily protein [Gossypium australe]|uniref:DNA/RNA polymerases superfamily protein n=1 Tax=Gossypium australe TaxID=47621 RepID=A0A5B6VVE5_9ROSI|nr:DNA/RNA polymerases superfamily protein [Gossypium australe]